LVSQPETETARFYTLVNKLFGDESTCELEHRCYNGVCFFAASGCFVAAFMNSLIGISVFPTIVTLGIGIVYGVLYGYWNQIESYIQAHSEVDFSHSICPECAKEHFPELDISKAENP
jgi:hypothetical protein